MSLTYFKGVFCLFFGEVSLLVGLALISSSELDVLSSAVSFKLKRIIIVH